MEAIQSSLTDNKVWTNAVYKEHLTSVYIRIDDFKRFTKELLIPLFAELKAKNISSDFFYRLATDFWLGVTYGNIVQLNFRVSPYNLEAHLKPILYPRLNSYFGQEFLKQLNVDEISDKVLQPKTCLDGFELWRLKIFGIEEYCIDDLIYVVGKRDIGIIRDLNVKSSNIILREVFGTGDIADCTDERIIELSFLYYYPILHAFLDDVEEMYHFMAWLVYKTMYQIKEVKGVWDLQEWKVKVFLDSNQYFEDQKEMFIGYSQFILETLDNKDEFEEDWLNEWTQACKDCAKILTAPERSSKWPTIPFNYKDDDTIYMDIPESKYRHWKGVYYVLKMINSQLGITFQGELNLFNAIKNSLKVLVNNKDH